jgi:SNF2 family DNA or RNA helicase
VTVYRLISQGTIEEKILQRQELKQTLADEIIAAEDEGFKDLGKAELLSLFSLDEGQRKYGKETVQELKQGRMR